MNEDTSNDKDSSIDVTQEILSNEGIVEETRVDSPLATTASQEQLISDSRISLQHIVSEQSNHVIDEHFEPVAEPISINELTEKYIDSEDVNNISVLEMPQNVDLEIISFHTTTSGADLKEVALFDHESLDTSVDPAVEKQDLGKEVDTFDSQNHGLHVPIISVSEEPSLATNSTKLLSNEINQSYDCDDNPTPDVPLQTVGGNASREILTIPKSTRNSIALLTEAKVHFSEKDISIASKSNIDLVGSRKTVMAEAESEWSLDQESESTIPNKDNNSPREEVPEILPKIPSALPVTKNENIDPLTVEDNRSKTIQSEISKHFGQFLQSIYKINSQLKTIDIDLQVKFRFPVVAAVGMENVGKTYVVSRLIGANTMPIGMKHTETFPTFVLFNHDSDQDDFRVEKEFAGHKEVLCVSNLANVGTLGQPCIEQNDNHSVDNAFNVTISQKELPCLKISDLPGISEGYVEPTAEKINRLSKRLTEDCIADKSTLILEVIPCTERIRSNPIWKYIQNGKDAMQRTIGVLTKIDQVSVFEDATHRVRGDSPDSLPLDLGYVGLYNNPDLNTFEDQKTNERDLIAHHNPDLWEQSLVGIDTLINKIVRVFEDHLYRSKPEIINNLTEIQMMCHRRLHTLGVAIDDSNFEEVKCYLLQLYANDQWEAMIAGFKVPTYQIHNPIKRIEEAKAEHLWHMEVKSQTKEFIRTCGQKYTENWFEKLLANNTDEWKLFRFKSVLSKYKSLVIKRILTGLDSSDIDQKMDSFFCAIILFKDDKNLDKRFAEGLKNIVAMSLYTNVIQRVPIELCKCISSSNVFTEDIEYSQLRSGLELILCECKRALELLDSMPDDATPSIFSFEKLSVQKELGVYQKIQPIPESPRPIVSEIQEKKLTEAFTLARVRNRVKSEQPRSSGVVTSSSFGYAHEPSVNPIRRNRIRRFTTDDEFQELSNPFVLPSAPLLKPSRLSTRNPALLFRSIKPNFNI